MTMITEEVNIDILEKKSDGTFIKKNPSTKISQVDGLVPTLEDKASKGYVDAKILAIDVTDLDLSGKVNANTPIPAGTATKVTYDTKGLVTGGTNIVASDIPNLDTSKITTGTLAVSRIPSLDASKVTTGTFNHPNRIPQLEISKTNGLQTALNGTVKNTGNESIAGIKTFTGRLYANDGMNMERNTEVTFVTKRTDVSYDSPWNRYRWDRIFDKNSKVVGEILFTCANGASTATFSSTGYKDDGTAVTGTLAIVSDGIGNTYVTLPMRASPGTTDIVNYGKLLDTYDEISNTHVSKGSPVTTDASPHTVTNVLSGQWRYPLDRTCVNIINFYNSRQNAEMFIRCGTNASTEIKVGESHDSSDGNGYATITATVPNGYMYKCVSTGTTRNVVEVPTRVIINRVNKPFTFIYE